MGSRARGTVIRAIPVVWALVLSVLLLGGALGRGYTLSYDMVWVPDLALSRDVLGLGTALPRAIPSDAVVALLDEVLPGALLQKVTLLCTLAAAGTGYAALVRDRTVGAQLVAATLGVWNPYVAERLLLGHWPLLVGYAVLPWVALRLRGGGGDALPASVLPLLVLGSLSASAGLMTAVLAGAVTGRASARRWLLLALCLAGANAPWVVAGLVSPASATSDGVGALVFATGDEGMLAGPVAALSFGGIWNAEVVPGSRLGVAGVAFTVVLVVAALVGVIRVARGARVPHLGAFACCWCVGWGSAVLSWAAPGAIGWWGEHVPAGGLLRDGSRLLGLAVPLVVVLVALAVDGILTGLSDRGLRALVGVVVAMLPVSLMPDVAWGMGGRLDPVAYPAFYEDARRAVADAPAGEALSLPFVSYRVPEWNGAHRVLDPLPRYLRRTTVVNDALVVSGREVVGEDPEAVAVSSALALDTPQKRSAALREVGVSVVVAERIEGYETPELAGRTVLGGQLSVTVLGPAATTEAGVGRAAPIGAAWLAWLTVLLAPVAGAVRDIRPRRRRPGDET